MSVSEIVAHAREENEPALEGVSKNEEVDKAA